MDAKRNRVFWRTSIAIAVVITWVILALVITLAVRPSRSRPIVQNPSLDLPADLLTGQGFWLSPAAVRQIAPPLDPERDRIEAAERLNLYQMNKGRQSVLEELQKKQFGQ